MVRIFLSVLKSCCEVNKKKKSSVKYWSWGHRPPFIWKSDAETWGPERQQGGKDGSTICIGLVDEKHECSELHFAGKSLNSTQSRRAASQLASWSICDARLGSMTPDWSTIGSYELNLRLLSSVSPTLLFVSINTRDCAALHLSSVKVQGRVRLLMGQESCWMKERES